ncbi:hypothetical protein GCM10009758_12010 [Microbacterium hatanonis]
MPSHAEGGIDEDGSVALESGGEELDAAVEEDGGVEIASFHGKKGFVIRDPDPPPHRPGAGEVRQGERLGITAEDQNKPGITSCSISEYVSSFASA